MEWRRNAAIWRSACTKKTFKETHVLKRHLKYAGVVILSVDAKKLETAHVCQNKSQSVWTLKRWMIYCFPIIAQSALLFRYFSTWSSAWKVCSVVSLWPSCVVKIYLLKMISKVVFSSVEWCWWKHRSPWLTRQQQRWYWFNLAGKRSWFCHILIIVLWKHWWHWRHWHSGQCFRAWFFEFAVFFIDIHDIQQSVWKWHC